MMLLFVLLVVVVAYMLMSGGGISGMRADCENLQKKYGVQL